LGGAGGGEATTGGGATGTRGGGGGEAIAGGGGGGLAAGIGGAPPGRAGSGIAVPHFAQLITAPGATFPTIFGVRQLGQRKVSIETPASAGSRTVMDD
jgi:hypothetical protein